MGSAADGRHDEWPEALSDRSPAVRKCDEGAEQGDQETREESRATTIHAASLAPALQASFRDVPHSA
jgi:hypothetical protein